MRGLVTGISLAMMLASASAASAESYRIGAPLMLSGPGAFTGESSKQAMDMLAKRLNDAGGVAGRDIEVVYFDTEGKPDTAVRVASRLLRSERVDAIIGPVGSWEVPPVKAQVAAAGIPMMLLSSTRGFVEPPSECIFKVPVDEHVLVARTYAYLKEQGLTRIAILTSQDAYGDGGRAQLEAQAEANGIGIVFDEKYSMEDTDLTPLLRRVGGSGAQAVVNWSTARAPIVMTNSYRQAGLTLPLMLGSAALDRAYSESVGANGEGVLIAGLKIDATAQLPDSDPQKAVMEEFQTEYSAANGVLPNQFAASASDAFNMLMGALRKADGDGSRVCDALNDGTPFVGVTGTFAYTPKNHVGLDEKSVVLYRLEGGSWTLVN